MAHSCLETMDMGPVMVSTRNTSTQCWARIVVNVSAALNLDVFPTLADEFLNDQPPAIGRLESSYAWGSELWQSQSCRSNRLSPHSPKSRKSMELFRSMVQRGMRRFDSDDLSSVTTCWWRWQESLSESKCGSWKIGLLGIGDSNWQAIQATPATPNGKLWSDLWYRQRGGDPFAGARDSCMNRDHPNWFFVQSLELKLHCKSFGNRCSFQNWAEPSSSHLVIAIQTLLLRLSATIAMKTPIFLIPQSNIAGRASLPAKAT